MKLPSELKAPAREIREMVTSGEITPKEGLAYIVYWKSLIEEKWANEDFFFKVGLQAQYIPALARPLAEWEESREKIIEAVADTRLILWDIDKLREDLETLCGLNAPSPLPEAAAPDPAPPPSGVKINVRGGLKELASMLLKLESENTIDHVTDKDAAALFTVRGSPVNPESLRSVRSRDL